MRQYGTSSSCGVSSRQLLIKILNIRTSPNYPHPQNINDAQTSPKHKHNGRQLLVRAEQLQQNNRQRLYLNKMSSVLTNLSVIQKIAKDLVQAKHLNYSEQCLPYYIDESKFTVQNIQGLRNPSDHLLKSSLIRHRVLNSDINPSAHSSFNSSARVDQPLHHTSAVNAKCVVFLHGLGSSRLEALPLIELLPQDYCLFAFDFAGSGKSEGNDITYGLRQSEDVGVILDYLRVNKGIKEFVIWGRSMGAVAALLYSINLAQSSKQSITAKSQLSRVKGLVIDSPFSDFRQITKQIGLKRMKIPQFLIDLALSVIQSSFDQLLKDPKRNNKIYNPFSIKLSQLPLIQTKIPTVFVYSHADEVVPKQHSQKIIKNYRSLFEKLVMDECSHNQARPKETVDKIFQTLRKFESRMLRDSIRSSFGDQINTNTGKLGLLTRNNSVDLNQRGGSRARRGISVESKEKQKIVTISNTLTEQEQSTQKKSSLIMLQSYSSLKIEPKRQKISCKMTKNAYISDERSTDPTASNHSPLKIRLSSSINRQQTKISTKKDTMSKINSNANFYSTIEYDNSILQRKLLKNSNTVEQNEAGVNYRTLESKASMKYRRHSQLNRKVQYQLNHTRYL